MKILVDRRGLQAFTLFMLVLFLSAGVLPQKRSKANVSSIVRGQAKTAPIIENGETPTPSFSGSGPYIFEGNDNPSCATLNSSALSQYAFIGSDWELKINDPTTGTYSFENTLNNDRVEVRGGLPSNGNQFIQLTMTNNTELGRFVLTASSSSLLTRKVTAVIVKGGHRGPHVYTYPPTGVYLDNGPFTLPPPPPFQGISHISFCMDATTAPSAAPVSLSGRVVTSFGRAISRAAVTVLNVNTGESRTVYTNSFGYYRIDQLAVSDFYIVSVSARGYTFGTSSYSFALNQSVENVNFVAN